MAVSRVPHKRPFLKQSWPNSNFLPFELQLHRCDFLSVLQLPDDEAFSGGFHNRRGDFA